jgi:hypothetical protein
MMNPVAIALVICDSLYRDVPGGKPALVGLFSHITASRFPALHPRMCVYVAVTDVSQQVAFRLEIVNPENDQAVVMLKGPAPRDVSRLQVLDMHFDLRDLVFPSAGLYFVRFWGNDSLILQRPLQLLEAKPESGQQVQR